MATTMILAKRMKNAMFLHSKKNTHTHTMKKLSGMQPGMERRLDKHAKKGAGYERARTRLRPQGSEVGSTVKRSSPKSC